MKAWKECYAAYECATISVKAFRPATLRRYLTFIEELAARYPQHWRLIVGAEGKGRAEQLERYRREHLQHGSRALELHFLNEDKDYHWDCCLQRLTKDAAYWKKHVDTLCKTRSTRSSGVGWRRRPPASLAAS